MELETMRELLKDRKIKQISDFTGLSGVTIYNIRDGVNLSPTLSTMKKIEAYFKSCDERVGKSTGGQAIMAVFYIVKRKKYLRKNLHIVLSRELKFNH